MTDPITSLINNVSGSWSAYEIELREVMGHTNYNVVLRCLDEARKAQLTLHQEHEHGSLTDKATAWDAVAEKNAEIRRLRIAIRWALGEAPDAAGHWFGEAPTVGPAEPPKYWWRSHLRKISGFETWTYDAKRRTLIADQEQEAKP